MDAGCEAIETLERAGLRIRVLSYDVRRSGMLPEAPGPRFSEVGESPCLLPTPWAGGGAVRMP